MVDPDHVRAVQSDTVAAPDVLGVDVGDVDVLDDDVLGAAHKAQTLALDDTGRALTDQTLVGLDGDAEGAGLVVADRDLGGVLLVVIAPAVLVDGDLFPEAGSVSRELSYALFGFHLLTWQAEPVPQGAQPEPEAVPSDPVKSKVLVKTMTRAWLSPRYETSSAVVVG